MIRRAALPALLLALALRAQDASPDALADLAAQGRWEDLLGASAERLAAGQPDLVAMDCMSYTPTTKHWVKGPLGVPALLAITATGRVLREMLD